MAFSSAYRQHNYMGEFASDAAVLIFIQAELWDSLGTGLGTPRAGMFYYNTQLTRLKFYDGTGWRVLRGDFDFQESVINFYDPTVALPVGPAVGDRYIASATGSGWILNWIYEYDGALWMGFQPDEGATVEVETLDQYWHFNGAAWVLMATVFAHNNLSGIQGGVAGEYYHLALGDQVYYVGKEGNDANNGLTEGSKFLTFGAAIAAAVALTPTANNRFSIQCCDAGIYTENLTIPSYVCITANCGVIVGNHTVVDESALHVEELQATAGVCVTKSAGASSAHVKCNHMVLTGVAIGMVCTSGHIYFNIEEMNMVNGFGVGSASTEELHGWVGKVHITGTGIAFAVAGTGKIEVVGNGVYDAGNGTAFWALPASTGYISAVFNDVDCNVNWNLASAAAPLYLVADRIGVAAGGNTETGIAHVTSADGQRWEMTDRYIYDWIMFNGAVADTLNGGKITTSRLPVGSVDPGIQFKDDMKHYSSNRNVTVEIIAAHSTTTQTLDIDLNYVTVNPAENFNTKAAGAVLNATPVTPGTAYQRFTFTFTVPLADILEDGSIEFRMSRDTGGADTGDLHIWAVRVYQVM